MSGIPWRDLLRFGLCDLNLKPKEFWSLTPVELMLMSRVEGRADAFLRRGELEDLMNKYPDQAGNTKEE